jgi:outer membrane receptor protein involved in Fe transport
LRQAGAATTLMGALCLSARAAPVASVADAASAASAAVAPTVRVDVVKVEAARLDAARNGLSPEAGSSVYRIDASDIARLPQGDDTPLNQVLLQAPGVADDSYGQLHVRGDHADLQYRINGILIPEPISGFGQSFDTRIIDQVNLLTGALPAQYGYRTAGVIDITTKTGEDNQGGAIDVYGGSHQTLQTSADVYGNSGPLSYFLTGTLGENNLGIEAPTSASDPLHDHTREGNSFGYLSYLLDAQTRLSVMFGTAANQFQLPNTPGLTPVYAMNGVSSFNSADLNETQSELNQFVVLALQGRLSGDVDYQVALSTRYTRTQFNPDPVGDLIFNGVASQDFHSDRANDLEADFTDRLDAAHTLRYGVSLMQEHAEFADTVTVFPADAEGKPLSDIPETLGDASQRTGYLYSAYVQDEWRLTDMLTLNYGLRFDGMDEYVAAHQVSPRLSLVYQWTPSTTVHAGYARYFTPPSFELVSSQQIAAFNGTTNASQVQQNDPVQPERDNYYDVGVVQQFGPALKVGLDAYYKQATQLLDEGQFGTALIYTPFNYAKGRVYGIEWTTSYRYGDWDAYANIAYSRALGTEVDSAQFNFDAAELAYIASNWVYLDHDQRVTASYGASYQMGRTTWSADATVGSGLRAGFANTDKLPWSMQLNLGVLHRFDAPVLGRFDARVSLVNALGRVYELRDGSGIGVQAPQYGPYRALYAGVTKRF